MHIITNTANNIYALFCKN